MAKNDDWGKDAKVVKDDDWGKDAKVVKSGEPSLLGTITDALTPSKKSVEAAIRGASQGATFGFGDEIQAIIRSLSPIQLDADEKGRPTIGWNRDFGEYSKLRDEERAANAKSAAENTGAYLTGSIASSIPQAANIVNVARNASQFGAKLTGLLGQPGTSVAAQAARAGGVGGAYGAAHGAGQAETVGDIPAEAAKGAAIQGAISAAIPAAGAALSKMGGGARQAAAAEKLPPGITRNKAGNLVNEAGEVVNRLGRRIAGPEWANVSKPAAMARGETIAQGGAPVIGGAVGALQDTKATDPVDAIMERGKNAAAGAALGWGAGRIPQAGRALSQLGNTSAGQVATQAIASQPFRKIADYISSAQGATNPQVMEDAQQLQQVSEGADDSTRRKAAMAAQLSPNGRAVTNSTSPKRDEEE